MNAQTRNLVFLSYSRKDPEIYAEVRQRLIDQGLADSLWDDTEIRTGERWDPKIQEGMERAAVAVLIFSDGYFGRRKGGGEYILEKELPYLLERWQAGELDLLPVYWRPSPHFRPDRRDPVKPFDYTWAGKRLSFQLHGIQAVARNGCLADAKEPERRDALLALAAEAERRLEARRGSSVPLPSVELVQGRQPLAVELAIGDTGVRRLFRVGEQVLSLPVPTIPRAELDPLRVEADRSLPGETDRARIGRLLYRLLFGGPGREDHFPKLAEQAWQLPVGSTARTISLAVEIHCGPEPCDPWPLGLPWHLTAADGESLAECCGWSFESVPSGVHSRVAPILSAEPPLLLLVDNRAPEAARHEAELTQLIDRSLGFDADRLRCSDLEQLGAAVRRTPEPEILYVYGRADLDLGALAEALGDSVSLILLNLIGEPVPVPPPALVGGRKLVISTRPSVESARAREGGTAWLNAFLADTAGKGHQRIACDAFGPGVRLWSGCAGLERRVFAVRGALFRRQVIKLLLDRIAARREVSDEVASALSQGRGCLALVAAGTPSDHPDLLPQQVWHHYRHVREAGSRDDIRRLELATGPIADAAELLPRFAQAMGRGSDDWQDGLDRESDGLGPGEHLIRSLEWRLNPRGSLDPDPDQWRRRWLEAWLDLGIRDLAAYRRTGVLLVSWLIVESADPAAAAQWTEDAQALWRGRRPGLAATGGRFVHLRQRPLSTVPVDDVEYFLEHHYRLAEQHPDLDPFGVAEWACSQTGGDFAATVGLVERLHDTGFQAARDALLPGPGSSS